MRIEERFWRWDLEAYRRTGEIEKPVECRTCGAAVLNLDQHHDWHNKRGE